MANLKQQFGARLKLLRTQKGITQESLAAQSDLTIESISNIERGIFGPRFGNLEKIAAVLDIEVKLLFEFKGE
ncbi:MAG TPA: XRE family transcriptional regulator [Porticoccaceae bacterium]|jgi:transcriptional regulator with XRE-family HTH domain|nr:XRE family transcriptional regulator [Porticoccaceae bacterium]